MVPALRLRSVETFKVSDSGLSPTFNLVIVYLRDKTLLTKPQEKFIAGLYTLLSDEAVHPLIAKKEAARLSRNMVVEYGLLLLTQLEKAGM